MLGRYSDRFSPAEFSHVDEKTSGRQKTINCEANCACHLLFWSASRLGRDGVVCTALQLSCPQSGTREQPRFLIFERSWCDGNDSQLPCIPMAYKFALRKHNVPGINSSQSTASVKSLTWAMPLFFKRLPWFARLNFLAIRSESRLTFFARYCANSKIFFRRRLLAIAPVRIV